MTQRQLTLIIQLQKLKEHLVHLELQKERTEQMIKETKQLMELISKKIQEIN